MCNNLKLWHMNSWVWVLSLSGSLAHHWGGREREGGWIGHCCLRHRLDRSLLHNVILIKTCGENAHLSKGRSKSLRLGGRWLRVGRKSLITLTPPEVLFLLLQLSLDQSLGEGVVRGTWKLCEEKTTCCMMCWVSMVISWGLGTLAAWERLQIKWRDQFCWKVPGALGKH